MKFDLYNDSTSRSDVTQSTRPALNTQLRLTDRPSLPLQEVEFNLLEEQLQKTLSDLEKREKQLAEAELQV